MRESVFTRRQYNLMTKLADLDLDGILITNLTNVRYISSFTGSAGTCLMTPDHQAFFSDGRYREQSRIQVKGFDLYIDTVPHLEIANKNNLISNGLNLAFEGDFVSVNQFRQMQKLFPSVRWESTQRVIEELAAVKDETELALMRTAVEITDRVYEEILPLIKEGVTEKEIADELVSRYRRYGDGEAFPSIVAAGPNSALPHATPTDRPFRKGDFIIIDAAVKYAGYHADMTRTTVMGKATERHWEIYSIVKEAQRAGCKAARAGMRCQDLDSVVRDYITGKGYGNYFVHNTGHGLGLDVHTMPRLSQLSKEVLKENYVVTIEPGIYIPDWGGVRIEDDVVIGKKGCEILNKTPKELMILK